VALEGRLQFSKRIALVIGNEHYAAWPALHMGHNDATVIAATLKAASFELIGPRGGPQFDVTAAAMGKLEAQLIDAIHANPGAIVVIYYSGHGANIGGKNILVDVDARLPNGGVSDDAQLSVEALARAAHDAGSGVTIMFLDACRSVAGGAIAFGDNAAPEDTFISFGSYFGTYALEENGAKNSVYTAALAERMRTGWRTLEELHSGVARSVALQTANLQVPVYRADQELLGTQFHLGLTAPETIYAKEARSQTRNASQQASLAAKCAAEGTARLIINQMPVQEIYSDDLNLVKLRSPVSASETLTTCEGAYAGGARDAGSLRGIALAAIASSLADPSNADLKRKADEYVPLWMQATEMGDPTASEMLAVLESDSISAGIVRNVNVPLSQERMISAVRDGQGPLAAVIAMELVSPKYRHESHPILSDGQGNPLLGLDIMVKAARNGDPIALLFLWTNQQRKIPNAPPIPVREILRRALGRPLSQDAIASATVPGLTADQTLYEYAFLDALNGSFGPKDLKVAVQLAAISEPFFPVIAKKLGSKPLPSMIGCALIGGIHSSTDIGPFQRNPQLALRFFEIGAELGDDTARGALKAYRSGMAVPCYADNDDFMKY
jgi:hypothetical protein